MSIQRPGSNLPTGGKSNVPGEQSESVSQKIAQHLWNDRTISLQEKTFLSERILAGLALWNKDNISLGDFISELFSGSFMSNIDTAREQMELNMVTKLKEKANSLETTIQQIEQKTTTEEQKAHLKDLKNGLDSVNSNISPALIELHETWSENLKTIENSLKNFQEKMDKGSESDLTNTDKKINDTANREKSKSYTYSNVLAKLTSIEMDQGFDRLSKKDMNIFNTIKSTLIEGEETKTIAPTTKTITTKAGPKTIEIKGKTIETPIYADIKDISLNELEKMKNDLTKIEANLKKIGAVERKSKPNPNMILMTANSIKDNAIKFYEAHNFTIREDQQKDLVDIIKDLPTINGNLNISEEDKAKLYEKMSAKLKEIANTLKNLQAKFDV